MWSLRHANPHAGCRESHGPGSPEAASFYGLVCNKSTSRQTGVLAYPTSDESSLNFCGPVPALSTVPPFNLCDTASPTA
jgi:hypothetical protein